MNISKTQEGTHLTIALDGRLDTMTAPRLEEELRTGLNGITDLLFDLSGLDYISSAGLRVLLATQKVMARQGSMTLRGHMLLVNFAGDRKIRSRKHTDSLLGSQLSVCKLQLPHDFNGR
jgi:anti-sigma B factor antagonist